ncbi:MAG: alpha/beta hydrolase [Lachnospiraceae bacterium]|jgi:acetyl esterase/lipase|nr:alpha/beta hydrolase [Lachnospiraceae bacterium]
MRTVIEPGRKRKSINFIDNIVYSVQKDLNGNEMELKMSIMLQNGNSEMRLAAGRDDEDEDKLPKPAILWVPGGGYRGCDKNLMVAEMAFLADAGFVVASMYYRSSAEGHFPDQIIDVKTALRFLRAHAAEYEIDPDHIGLIGRSAGGHLSALAAMNSACYESEEWEGFSSDVQACCDLFGPVDLVKLMEFDAEMMEKDPSYRWKRVEDTHAGALFGGPVETMKERARLASPPYVLSNEMCPILILHGDQDALVPCEISENFYKSIADAGMEERADFYILKGAGHGTKEFFQPYVKELIAAFFYQHLRNST